jgi:hypothetical protein
MAVYVVQTIKARLRCGASRVCKTRWLRVHAWSCAERDYLFVDCQSLNEIFSTYSALNIR